MSINITIKAPKSVQAQYLRVAAGVRYWDDAIINGEPDETGTKTPLRKGDCWSPTINLETGQVLDWPLGVNADIHFKVCDEGLYFLQDAERKDVAQWKGYYVPNDLLCVGDNGYGDYIILKIDAEGFIKGWHFNGLDSDEWVAPDQPQGDD